MKPIIILIAIAIAGAGLGVGFLNAPNIDVVAQDVGVGHKTLTHPITTAIVNFHITAVKGNQGFFKNMYDACIIKSPQAIKKGATIFCKLTDMNAKVVAEGKKVLGTVLPPGIPTKVVIQTKIDQDSTFVGNIKDVTIVVQNPSP